MGQIGKQVYPFTKPDGADIHPASEDTLAVFLDQYMGTFVPKTTIIDKQGSITYIGESHPGANTDDAAWRITKIDESTNPNIIKHGVSIMGWDGCSWDDRYSLTYE